MCRARFSYFRRAQAPHAYLLHSRQALELGAAEVLLLQRGRLQHEVLLLRRVHLLQVLSRRAGLPVQGLLDHLGGGQRSAAALTCCRRTFRNSECEPHPPPTAQRTPGLRPPHHLAGRRGRHLCLVYLASLQHACSEPSALCWLSPDFKAAHHCSDSLSGWWEG